MDDNAKTKVLVDPEEIEDFVEFILTCDNDTSREELERGLLEDNLE